jgi:DNA-binding LacI/PurR family transcriptional regulator
MKSINLKIVSADHPKNRLGEKAAEMLIELINDPKRLSDGPVIYKYPTSIIDGDSIRTLV